MSNSSSSGRLHCPGCNARLAIPAGNKSPYIRCGVCNALFETEVEPSELTENRQPYPSKPSNEVLTIPASAETVPEPRSRPQNQQPSPEFNWSRPRRRGTGMRWTTGWLAIVALMFFGFVIFSLLSWADSSHPRIRSNGYSYSRSSSYPYGSASKSSTSVIDDALQKWQTSSNGYPKYEVNLTSAGSSDLRNKNIDSIKLDGRNLSNLEITRMSRLIKLRKLEYTNVNIESRDLKVLNSQRFFELNLSHSKWKTGQLHFDKKSFPYLTKLDLSYSNVQEFSLVDIDECEKLTHLNLRGTDLGDDGLDSLIRHPSLIELDLCETKITFDGLKRLRMPKLKLLKVTANVLSTKERESILKYHRGARVLVINEP